MEKIICIININDRFSGLIHTFRKLTNSFIENYLYQLGEEIDNIVFNNYLLINKANVISTQTLDNLDSWEILFVSDQIPLEKYTHIFDNNTLLMYHSTPSISDQNTITEINGILIKKGQKGQHEPEGDNGYDRLFQLTQVWENGCFDIEKYDAARKYIIDWFGINDELESKILLLHNCLGKKNIPKKIDDSLSNFQNEFTTFKKKIENISETNNKYIKLLTSLRDKLLET